MNRRLSTLLLAAALLTSLGTSQHAFAQQPDAPNQTPPPATPAAEDDDEPLEDGPLEDEPLPQPDASSGFEPLPDEPLEQPALLPGPSSGFSKMDEDFVPLEEIDEASLDPIFPAQKYPWIEWRGGFRYRHRVAHRFDLGTGGTSSILPPIESYTPSGNPADPDAKRLWGADMRLRLEPTLSITEGVRVHIEADLLANQVLGALPAYALPPNPIRPDPSRNQIDGGQLSPREREWFRNALSINEAYGELTGFFGTLRAGRMDNHWGTGMFYNDGDCLDCDWGDSIDRLQLETQVFGVYGSVAADFPGEGITSNNANTPLGQPYDRGQIDDVRQLTATVLYAPKTPLELERQNKKLTQDRAPVWNAGGLFTWRSQQGTFADPFSDPDLGSANNPLVYRGMNMYVGDAWGRFLYHPNSKTKMRVELEVMGVFGSMDNRTYNPVGLATDEEANNADVNCFNEDARRANTRTCNANALDFRQLGVALETEFSVGGPVDFGVNAGFASGGNTPNWALTPSSQLNGNDLEFFRFDPDYHVDLILFRNVIGTVTNAYYVNPYLKATFLDRGERKLRFDLDLIGSRAANMQGTPSGTSPWLGVEADGALRFFLKDAFHASFEGGILLPFEGLSAQAGRERLVQYGNTSAEFIQSVDASTAWTLQLKANWSF